jgi:hypothetical protein
MASGGTGVDNLPHRGEFCGKFAVSSLRFVETQDVLPGVGLSPRLDEALSHQIAQVT